jgi:hypothetical protein
MLFEQVAMNSEAYPRDRLAVLELVGRTTGDLADRNQPASPAPDQNAARLAAYASAANADTARTLAGILADVQRLQESNKADVFDGTSQPGTPTGTSPAPASQPTQASASQTRPDHDTKT